MTNETLSDKIYCSICGDKGGRKRCSEDILSKDVKEFIKRLKDCVDEVWLKIIWNLPMKAKIDELAGDKLKWNAIMCGSRCIIVLTLLT